MVSSIDLQALKVFLNGPITHDMIHKIVVATLQVIPCEDTKSKTYTSSNNTIKQLPSLMTFLTKLVKYTNVYTGTLMATLIYLQKLKSRLPKNAHGLPCTRHRILLSCLILSSKFHNDSSPKNKHWAKYTDGLFNVKDINLMERQLIFLLNWDLKVTNEEMCQSLQSFLEPIKTDIIKQEKFQKYLQQKNQETKQMANAAVAVSISATTTPVTLSRSSTSTSTSSLVSSASSCSGRSSRSSSISPDHLSPMHYSNTNNNHYRQDSSSSISSIGSNNSPSSVYSISPKHNHKSIIANNNSHNNNNGGGGSGICQIIDPIIELTAQKEELELKNFLSRKFGTTTTTTTTTTTSTGNNNYGYGYHAAYGYNVANNF